MNKDNSINDFRNALNKACGEIDEAARLSVDIFEDEELKSVRRELGRLMGIIDDKIFTLLPNKEGQSELSRLEDILKNSKPK